MIAVWVKMWKRTLQAGHGVHCVQHKPLLAAPVAHRSSSGDGCARLACRHLNTKGQSISHEAAQDVKCEAAPSMSN